MRNVWGLSRIMHIQSRPARGEAHVGLFLRQLLRRPGRIVALSPSSRHLARMMVREIGPDTGSVIELGAGTGIFTEALIGRGIAEDRLAIFEIDEAFADLLACAYPRAKVLRRSAGECGTAPVSDVGAVVSGLPLLSMPLDLQRAILGGAFAKLRPGGIFVQFTYGYRAPVAEAVREELGLVWTRSPRVWRNLPPARVYTFRQDPARLPASHGALRRAA